MPSKDCLALIAASEVVLGKEMMKLITSPPIWRYLPSPTFNRFDRAALEIMEIAKKYVEKAAADLKLKPGKEGEKSVLEKLILSNKGELDIPVVMAIDGMMAGIDTTGNTVSFLLYHLAINPEAQERLYEEIKKEVGEESLSSGEHEDASHCLWPQLP